MALEKEKNSMPIFTVTHYINTDTCSDMKKNNFIFGQEPYGHETIKLIMSPNNYGLTLVPKKKKSGKQVIVEKKL